MFIIVVFLVCIAGFFFLSIATYNTKTIRSWLRILHRVPSLCRRRASSEECLPMHYMLGRSQRKHEKDSPSPPPASTQYGTTCIDIEEDDCKDVGRVQISPLLIEFEQTVMNGNKAGISVWLKEKFPDCAQEDIPQIALPACVFLTRRGKTRCRPITDIMESTDPLQRQNQAAIVQAMEKLDAFTASLENRHIQEEEESRAPEFTENVVVRMADCNVFPSSSSSSSSQPMHHPKKVCNLSDSPVPCDMEINVPPFNSESIRSSVRRAIRAFKAKPYLPSYARLSIKNFENRDVDLRNLLLHALLIAEERGVPIQVEGSPLYSSRAYELSRIELGWHILSICLQKTPFSSEYPMTMYTVANTLLNLPAILLASVMTMLIYNFNSENLHLIMWLGNPLQFPDVFDMAYQVESHDPANMFRAITVSDTLKYSSLLRDFVLGGANTSRMRCEDCVFLFVVASFFARAVKRYSSGQARIQNRHYHQTDTMVYLEFYITALQKAALASISTPSASANACITAEGICMLLPTGNELNIFVNYTLSMYEIVTNATFLPVVTQCNVQDYNSLYGKRVLNRDFVAPGMKLMRELPLNSPQSIELYNMDDTTAKRVLDAGVFLWRVFLRRHGNTVHADLDRIVKYYQKVSYNIVQKKVDDAALLLVNTIEAWNEESAIADAGCTLILTAHLSVLHHARRTENNLVVFESRICQLMEQIKPDSYLYEAMK